MNDKTATPVPGNGTGPFPSHLAIKELADLGVKATDPAIISIDTTGLGSGVPEKVPAIFDRSAQKANSVRPLIEEFRSRPDRRTGIARMQTLGGFYDLVNRHKDDDSAIFVDLNWRKPKFLAVVDYHRQLGEADEHEPRNLRHRIEYEFPLSDDWQAWIGANGKMMEQGDFAAFIEDHIAEISSPTDSEKNLYATQFQTQIADPYEIVTLSRGLSVSVDAKVAKAVTLQSGEGEIAFSEVHRDGGGQKLSVPGLFILSVPVFFRGANVRFVVRLRYRVLDGAVKWAFQIWRPDEFVTAAVEKDRDAVAVETGLPTYAGAPEA